MSPLIRTIRSVHLLLACALLSAAACRAQPAIHDLQATPVRPAGSTVSAPFGGAVLGEPVWLSANGRIALLYRVDADTDGDGRLEAEFGHHGTTLKDAPRLWAYDLESGTETRYDELLTVDPTDRYAALRLDGRYLLLDAQTGAATDLSPWGISGEDDANACLPPRQLSYAADGRRIAFLRGSPARLVVREIEGGEETEVRADSGVLWRGGFGPWPGWMQLDVVQAGDSLAFPELRTSCHSRAALPFAASWSVGGWEGPEFRSRLVSPDGERITVPGTAIPVGRAAYAVHDTALFRVGGRRIALPEGCTEMLVMEGAAHVILDCGEGSALLDPASGRRVDLPAAVWAEPNELTAVADADGRWWAPVLLDVGPESHARGRPPVYRLSRLRMDDGRIEAGPRVQGFELAEGGWAIASGDSSTYALQIGTGRLLEARTGWRRYGGRGGVVYDSTRTAVEMIALEHARSFAVDSTAATPTLGGCVIEAARRDSRMQRGPWRRRCLAENPQP